MDRKQFLIYTSTATGLLPLLLAGISCSDYTSDGASMDDDSFTVVSSSDGGHTHTVTILFADVNSPPSTDKTLITSATSHTHSLILSQSDFQALSDGQELSRDTSTNSSHKHTFTIKVPANSVS